MSAIEVVLLGTGSPIPDPSRAGPSTLVQAGGHSFLVDCGRAVLMRAAAGFPHETDGMAVVDHDKGMILVGEIAGARKIGDAATRTGLNGAEPGRGNPWTQ